MPVATVTATKSAQIFFTLQILNALQVSDLLLFETSEKRRFIELMRKNQFAS